MSEADLPPPSRLSRWTAQRAALAARTVRPAGFGLLEQAAIAREGNVRPLQLILCIMLPILWEGLPFAAVGLPRAGGFYLMTPMILAGIVLFLFKRAPRYQKYNLFTAGATALSVLFLAVSFASGALFFYNPPMKWLPELVYYSPCLLIFLLIALDIRISELLWGMTIAAAIAAGLVIFDSVSHVAMMDQYATRSGFQDQSRRVMLLKNELGVATCLAFVWAVSSRSIGRAIFCSLILVLVFYDLVQITETRLVIGAALLAIAAYAAFISPLERRFVIIIGGVVAAIFLGPLIFERYIDRMHNLSSLVEDGSVKWRILTVAHYKTYFEQTYGLGFGLMSLKDGSGSILAYSIYDAPMAYGIARGQWGFFIADISLYGPLYQFGYLGLLLVIAMTALTAFHLIRYGFNRDLPIRQPVAAAGFFVLFLLISLWPTNLFTLSWSMLNGNMLYAAAARAWYIHRTYRQIDRTPRRTGRFGDLRAGTGAAGVATTAAPSATAGV